MSWRTRKWWNLASPLLVYKVQGLQAEHEARVAGQVNASQCDSCETCSDHLESSRELPPARAAWASTGGPGSGGAPGPLARGVTIRVLPLGAEAGPLARPISSPPARLSTAGHGPQYE